MPNGRQGQETIQHLTEGCQAFAATDYKEKIREGTTPSRTDEETKTRPGEPTPLLQVYTNLFSKTRILSCRIGLCL